jgi:hypothetical protein
MCFGGSVTLKANTTGGILPFLYLWNIPGTDSTITFIPPAGNNLYTVKVTDVCTHAVYDTARIIVHPVPVADAGVNITIPNGTSTTLHGTASGGYGTYGYSWTSNPPGFTSSLANPSTGNMDHTMIFILTVTDLSSGCQSPPVQVIVAIAGGALSVNPVAMPDAVCLGDTAHLFALSGGGSGLYTYHWTSTPAGFTSSNPNPIVTPSETTTYHIMIDDGFNQRSASTSVLIYPLPYVHLGPADSAVCIYDTVRLDAGNPGSAYLWSTGSTGRHLTTSTTGIGYDVQTYSVVVTNENGCSSSSTINVIFTFDNCVGISEHAANPNFTISPNPARSSFRLHILNRSADLSVQLMDLTGRKLLETSFISAGDQSDDKTINISSLNPGTYILHVRSEKFAGSAKLVVY